MKVKKIGSIYKVTADEGMWLTFYDDEQDILFYHGAKSFTTNAKRLEQLREITNAQHEAYELEKEAAMQQGEPEGGE